MMGALKPSEQYEVVHKLVTTTSADEQLLVLEALLADCHADTRMPLLARLTAASTSLLNYLTSPS